MFTRCPHCRTTFRITAEALEMAAGQVRCGRCTHVFDANAELTDALPAETRARGEDGSGPAAAHADTRAAGRTAAPERAEAPARQPRAAPAASDDGILFLSEDWRVDAAAHGGRHRAAWAAAAAVCALILAGQLAHHFRADLARHALVGGLVQSAYGALGIELVPRWDPGRYRIRDWAATAEQEAEGRSSLLIRAEIENSGPDPMPQPHVFLTLKDRWDAVVASRVFAPEEYMRASRADTHMRAGSTTIAEIEVVDPGPDAYGFELDVCVAGPAGSDGVRCANDDVFR